MFFVYVSARRNAHAHRQLVHDTYLSPSGLVFLKEDEVLMDDDHWTIVLVMNVTEYFLNAQRFKENVKNLEEIVRKSIITDTISYGEELYRLRSIAEDLLNVNKGLTDMLNKDSGKHFINERAKALFGGDRNEEMQELSRRVLELQSRMASQESSSKYQMSIKKLFNQKIEENTEKLIYLTANISQEFQTFDARVGSSVLEPKKIYIKLINLSSNFRLLEAISLHSLLLANQLQSGLEMAAQGKLSFSLISDQELKEESMKISSMVPFDLKPSFGLRAEDMYKYRKVAQVTAIAYNDLIMLSVRLPLISEEQGFDLYKLHGVPMMVQNFDKITRIQLECEYFLVSKNKQYYALLSYNDLKQCTSVLPKICPPVMILTARHVPTCTSATFFQEKENMEEYCKHNLLTKPHRPVWLVDKENNGWIYSVAEPTRISLHCDDAKETEDAELIGTNILANVSHCTILGKDFKLLRTSESRSYTNSTIALLSANPMESVLNAAVVELLSNTVAFNEAVEDLRKAGLVKEGLANSEEVSLLHYTDSIERGSNVPSVRYLTALQFDS